MLTDLKTKIKVNTNKGKEEMKHEGLQIEIENDHLQDFDEVMQGDPYSNDYFLGKREDSFHESLMGLKPQISQPSKRLVTPSNYGKYPKVEESSPSYKQHAAPIEPMREEIQTPRPALNISLIDKTYTYNDVINNMWDDPDQQKDQLFAPGEKYDDPMNEFRFTDD